MKTARVTAIAALMAASTLTLPPAQAQ